MRTWEWNYTEVVNPTAYQGNYRPQLYNSIQDPEELSDVAEKYPDVVRRLSRLLRDYVASGTEITRGSFRERERT